MSNIVQLDTIRLERHKPRKCTCDPYDKSFTVDKVNREITCGCGLAVDPYEAMEHLAYHYERINDQHKAMDDQRQQWIKEKPYSVLFKELERHYRRGTMLPGCPECGSSFEFNKITSWTNAEYYRKWRTPKAPDPTEST